jgi:hypothetical protein
VKALRDVDTSSRRDPDFQRLALLVLLPFMGLGIFGFIIQGIISSPDSEQQGLFGILTILTTMMSAVVPLLSLAVVATRLFYYFAYFASLLF